MKFSINLSMLVVFSLLTLVAYQKELISRQLFVSERKEREIILRQSQNDRRYLDWLRKLAQFLRHEVRQPLAQINSSIELAALKDAEIPGFKPHLLNAMNATQHVWHLIERASRATDAEAFVRQSRPEQVELLTLLEPLVQGFTQTYSGVEFRFQTRITAMVWADPVLLKEAVSNLLSNAASFAEEDTVIDISLRLHSGQIQIAVRNEGPLIEGDTDALFQPFASSRSGGTSEHHGLGLYLVRLIAQQHGGTAAINNTAEGTGVEASLSLPVAN